MAGSITVLPQRRTGFGDFVDALKPSLEQAFNIYMEKKLEEDKYQKEIQLQGQQRQQAYQEAQRMGLIQQLPPTSIPTSSGQANIMPLQGIKVPPQYRLNQQPDMESSIKFNEHGIPQFGQQTVKPTSPVQIFTASSSGELTPGGAVPKGSKILTPSQLETPGQKQERDISTSKIKKAQEAKMEVQAIEGMVDSVWSKAEELIPSNIGVQKAAISGFKKDIGTTKIGRFAGISDENAITFNEFKEGTLSMLIRSLGEKGMLTDQDIKRARDFEPSTWDTPKIRKGKQAAMKDFLKSKISAYYQNIEQPLQGTQEQYQNMDQDPEYQKYLQAIGG